MNELLGLEVGESGAELITEEDESGEMDVVFVFPKVAAELDQRKIKKT